jgi:hypothetical protein
LKGNVMAKTDLCFKEGKEAYFSGLSKKDNPYDLNSENFIQWQKGFKFATKMDIDQDPDGN